MAVGGVGGSQFKTIIPLATQPNVQQIQVPGSRFHYVRLVTATTASSTAQPSGPSTSSIQPGELRRGDAAALTVNRPILTLSLAFQLDRIKARPEISLFGNFMMLVSHS